MAASGTSTWPTLTAGNKARASEVETKFDWLEANILPMLGGSTTDAVYDLGNTTTRWRDIYLTGIRFTTLNLYASATAAVTINAAGIISIDLQSSARAARTTVQTLTSATDTKIQFQTEQYDTRAEYDNVTNFRFSATVAGKYFVHSNVDVQNIAFNTTTTHLIKIYINGVEFSAYRFSPVSTAINISVSDILNLAANDYIEIFVNATVNTTTNFPLVTQGTGNSYLAVHKIA